MDWLDHAWPKSCEFAVCALIFWEQVYMMVYASVRFWYTRTRAQTWARVLGGQTLHVHTHDFLGHRKIGAHLSSIYTIWTASTTDIQWMQWRLYQTKLFHFCCKAKGPPPKGLSPHSALPSLEHSYCKQQKRWFYYKAHENSCWFLNRIWTFPIDLIWRYRVVSRTLSVGISLQT